MIALKSQGKANYEMNQNVVCNFLEKIVGVQKYFRRKLCTNPQKNHLNIVGHRRAKQNTLRTLFFVGLDCEF